MKALTFIEIDVDFCTLEFGIEPCRAQLGWAGDAGGPYAVDFDGEDTWLTRGAGLTGAADSKLVTVSGWLRIDAEGIEQRVVYSESSAAERFTFYIDATEKLCIVGRNAAGTIILNVQSSANAISIEKQWVHFIASFDLSDTGKRHLYVDDAAVMSVVTYTNEAIDFTNTEWAIGAEPNGDSPYNGRMAELWVAPGVYIDLSVEDNRRKFFGNTGRPVSLGATGQIPTGTTPLIYMSGQDNDWAVNKGTGGGFTIEGIVRAAEFATGVRKCFNSLGTCQDRLHFTNDPVTMRFAMPTDYLPRDVEIVAACVDGVSFTPAVVSLGKNLGQRASLSVSFFDFKHSDTGPGFDPYRLERPYDPWTLGTFWGKFRARQPFLRGRNLRVIRGLLGEDIADMDTRHYIIESFNGPDMQGRYSITAKDVLKLADGDRAQAPLVSQGFLTAELAADGTSATLNPSGIGNLEYPASGYVAIGGKEIVAFTRSSDTLTLTRAQFETEAVVHDAGDRVQLCLQYSGEDPGDIIADLLENYAGVPAGYIPISQWNAETSAFLRRLYSSLIAEPTSVNSLISELIEQAALALWWDDSAQIIRLQVLRQISTEADDYGDENVLQGTLGITEQPDARISQIWTYFAQVNPLKAVTDADNFRSIAALVDLESETDYGSPAIVKVFSRWIPAGGRAVAERLNDIKIGRFRTAPRKFTFSLFRRGPENPALGGGYQLNAWPIQDPTGARDSVPIQITRLNPSSDAYGIEAEEMRFVTFDEDDLSNRLIIYDSALNNVNLRTTHDLLYPPPVDGDEVACIVEANVVIGSVSTALPAFNLGDWPAGVAIEVIVRGRIQGAGGRGGQGGPYGGSEAGEPGYDGGTALYTRYAFELDATEGAIWGGGGGGEGGVPLGGSSAGGGGGGAGTVPGAGGPAGDGGINGSPGTPTAGGAGGEGGDYGDGAAGGGPGLNGGTGFFGFFPAAAGAAIDGISYITVVDDGDARGPQVN